MNEQVDHPITKIFAEEIKDSRGNPTIKVTVWSGNLSGDFSVPSGASTGSSEAHELRDADGKGVMSAIGKVNNAISPALLGRNVLNQKEIDETMIALDGTKNKDNLGGNSMLGVSIACAKLAAKISQMETFEYLQTLLEIKPSRQVPYLFMNLINGGKHAHGDLPFQEYFIVPETENISEAISIGVKIQNSLREMITKETGENSIAIGDEGGLAFDTDDVKKPLLFLKRAIRENGMEGKVRLSLDIAANSFFENGAYRVGGKNLSSEELMHIYEELINEFELLSIEDPFEENDFENFAELNKKNVIVVGDDITTTNVILIQKAVDKKSISAIIIKPNQIGTLTETLFAMKLAREKNIELIVSHRSGETDDDFIADLAFAFNVFGLKAGSPQKPERMVKYKRLIEIVQKSRE